MTQNPDDADYLEIESGSFSLKGPADAVNKDRFRLLNEEVPLVRKANIGHVYAVVDGVSRSPYGRQFAQLIVDKLAGFFSPEVPKTPQGFHGLLSQLNEHIVQELRKSGSPHRVAAGTFAWVRSDGVDIFQVGDTALFWLTWESSSQTKLERVTGADGTFFGMAEDMPIAHRRIVPEEGDRLLLVSDGVLESGGAQEWLKQMLVETMEPKRAAQRLVEQARSNGSLDDATAVVLDLLELGH